MGEVISLLTKLKSKQQEHEAKLTEFVKRARECEAEGMEEYKLTYTNLGIRELDEISRLRKQILDIEQPLVRICSFRISTEPLVKPSPLDFTPSVTPSIT